MESGQNITDQSPSAAGFVRRFTAMRTMGTFIVMLPPGYEAEERDGGGRRYPICLLLHGNSASEFKASLLADGCGREGVIYVAVRAPHPFLRMPQGQVGWTAELPDPQPESDPVFQEDRLLYAQWIFDCASETERLYRSDGRLFILGHSQGGQFAVNCALLHSERVVSVFDVCGSRSTAPFVTSESLAKLKETGVRVNILHGESDPVVLPEVSRNLAQMLTNAGVAVKLNIMPGWHEIDDAMLAEIRKWVDAEIRGK